MKRRERNKFSKKKTKNKKTQQKKKKIQWAKWNRLQKKKEKKISLSETMKLYYSVVSRFAEANIKI